MGNQAIYRGAYNRGNGVDALAEYEGNVVEYDVTEHSAANCGEHTHYDGYEGTEAKGEANFSSSGCEDAEADSVEDVIYVIHHFFVFHVLFLQQLCGYEYAKGSYKADNNIYAHFLREKAWQPLAYHSVAEHSTAEAGGNGKEENTEDIRFLIYGDHCACCSKGNYTNYIEYED